MSRGIDNCNPGNIRLSKVFYRGEVQPSQDAAFKQFSSMEWGYRAMFVLLDTYARRYGLNTIRGMISRYAPPSENNTEAYIAAVCEWTGIAADEVLDTRSRRDMVPIVVAMSRIENGLPALRPQVEKGFDLTGWE
ncbi:MAG: structural protein P5 [Rikenellaceae bacterium]|nr:structural protein P5 [Rikenellaceae bacterium]